LLTEKFPYFSPVTLPGRMYPGSPLDTKIFGLTAPMHPGAAQYFQEMQDLSTLLQVEPAPRR
jgi:TRAP-type uncharacterized transport system substrate-binding protein